MAAQPSSGGRGGNRVRLGEGLVLALVLAIAIFATFSAAGCSKPATTTEPTQSEPQPAATEPATQPVTAATELKIEDTKVGTGAEAKVGDTVTVHYTGYLTDGTKFDSSKDSGQPFQFTIGQGLVITGWEQGIPGMKVGGTRTLTIPPELGYGAQGAGGAIPPNATLVFEVELVAVN